MDLVTGGAGFIGSSIAHELVRSGRKVRILDNFSTGRRVNLAGLEGRLEVHEADLRDAEAVARAMKGVEVVFHQGALPSVPRSISDPVASNDVNVGGTLNVLQAARAEGVRRVLFASSSSIYGDAPEKLKSESLPPRPMSPYAVGKLAAEKYCQVFHAVYGLETVCLRYFNVFGPRQDPESRYAAVIPLFTRLVLSGSPPRIYGDGEQSRDFTFIDNVVRGNLLAAETPGVAGMVFNIACGGSISVNRMARGILELLGRTDLAPVHGPERTGDIRDSLADISLARERLGFEPLVGFDEGLRLTVEHLARQFESS
ncbi:SDR family oxidoreductase [Candidatus Fermentibacteria bacterium]|nr:SDR family oxidoreductase [Candidatus Fermentibacteria bacterium]